MSIWSARLLEAATSSSSRGIRRVRAATQNHFNRGEGGQLTIPFYRGKAELQPIPVTPLNQVGSRVQARTQACPQRTDLHCGKAPTIGPSSPKGKIFVTAAPRAQPVISSSLNVKNPGRFSRQPPLVRPDQGIRASSRPIGCLQQGPRCAPPPA